MVDLGARTKTSEEKIELLEVQIRNKNLLLRGVSEKFGQSNLREEFEAECQKFMETEYLIDIEKIFRLNSKVAKKRNLPRDILVSFNSKSTRDEILNKHRESPWNIDGKDIIIFQDLPRETLRRRGDFYFHKQILYHKQIRFFWKIPFALEILLSSGRKVIKTLTEARELADYLTKDDPAPSQQDRALSVPDSQVATPSTSQDLK